MSKLLRVRTYRNIVEGWKNYAFKSESVEALARARAKTCSLCPSAIKGTYAELMDDDIIDVKGMLCDVCKCPLSTKLRSTEETCPEKKW